MRPPTTGSAAWRSCARSDSTAVPPGRGGREHPCWARTKSLGRREATNMERRRGGAAIRRGVACWWRRGRRRRTRSQVKSDNRFENVELALRLEAARRADGSSRAVHSGDRVQVGDHVVLCFRSSAHGRSDQRRVPENAQSASHGAAAVSSPSWRPVVQRRPADLDRARPPRAQRLPNREPLHNAAAFDRTAPASAEGNRVTK